VETASGSLFVFLMDWHISPISRSSAFSGEPFERDDRVASLLVRVDSEIERIDLRESEESYYRISGDLICRWTQLFKPRDQHDKEVQEALKLTADNLFVSLFEGEDAPNQENSKLKRLLSLMLERRRLLRLKHKEAGYLWYIHRPSKIEYPVPDTELDPQFFIENQKKLAFLGASEDEGSAKQTESPPKGSSSRSV